MKRNILLILTVTTFIFSGCLRSLEKEGISPETIYKGRVIDAKNNPLSGIMVRITNGNLIYNSVSTGQDGIFQITVDISKINNSYYIQVGEGDLIKRSSLKGFGLDVYDYGDIPFVDVKLPNVETVGLTAVSTTAFTCKCNVKSQGASIVTERGVCWSTNIPSVDDNVVRFGSGEGIYSCTVSDASIDVRTTTYYVRAYARNENGYGYGDAIEINSSKLEYFSLPSVEFGGYTYHVHPGLGSMQWSQAVAACDNLVAYGFDDWYLPNKEEMLAIAKEISTMPKYTYWTSTKTSGNSWYYVVYYSSSDNGWIIDNFRQPEENLNHVIPVRKD